jgi:hypothetical protein
VISRGRRGGISAPWFPPMSPALRAVAFADFVVDPDRWVAGATWGARDLRSIEVNRLAATAVRLHDHGLIQLPAQGLSRLRSAAFAGSSRTVQIARATGPGLAELRSRGIPFVITKGPGIAQCEVRSLERPFDDLDVLVAPLHFLRAASLLSQAGYRESSESSPPRHYFDRWCREAVNLRDGAGGSIDLHHHVPPWRWTSAVHVSDLVTRRTSIRFGGETLEVASPLDNLLVVALHIFSDRNRAGATVRTWRDLLVLARAVDETEAAALFRGVGLQGWLQWILEQYPAEVRPEPLAAALGPVAPVPPHRLRLRVLVPTGVGAGSHSIRYAFRLPFPHACLYLLGMAWPSREFLAARFPGARHLLIRWWLDRGRLPGSERPDPRRPHARPDLPRVHGEVDPGRVAGVVTGRDGLSAPALGPVAGRAEERTSWR